MRRGRNRDANDGTRGSEVIYRPDARCRTARAVMAARDHGRPLCEAER